MQKISFNEGWRYAHVGKEDWTQVTLPHDAMLAEPRTGESTGGTNTGWFEGHDYIYEKIFSAPENWQSQEYAIQFGGVYHRAEVSINGVQISAPANGYIGFTVPLDGLLREGDNIIRVIAHNADQPNSRWYSGAGIYRPVWLIQQPKQRILPESILIKTVDYARREIEIAWATSVPGDVRLEILDGETVLQTVRCRQSPARMIVQDAELWHPDHPRLYTCRLTFGDDVHQLRFGIVMVKVDAGNGFCLNGERVLLHGACMHHDNGILGAVGHPFAERRKIQLLKNAGYNAIRSSHNPCSEAILDACDELGMMVLDEYVDMWYIHKTQHDYAECFEKNWRSDLKAIVEKDRNHPSVVMYSIGNEVAETAQKKGIELTGQMRDLLHELDDRPVTCGINIFFNFLSSMGFGVYSDAKAKAEAEKAAKQAAAGKKARKKAVGSEFFNNLSGLLGADFMKFGATLHGSNIKTRDAFARLDVAGYNYGINRYKKDLNNYPDRVILGSETFVCDAYKFYEIARNHPALIGDFVWTGIDYLGEVGLGAWDYRDYASEFGHGPGWITAGSGRLDINGRPWGEMAYTQVAFEQSPIRIAVAPADHYGEPHSPSAWRMTNSLETWSWNGCEGHKTAVEVYARGAYVELFLNMDKIGMQKIKNDCKTVFKVNWQPGTLTAIVYGEDKQELARTSLQSAGNETELRLEPEKATVSLGELCYVRLRYTDSNGMSKPLIRGKIKLSVKGGKLLGFGSACPYNETGYLTDTSDTYYGEALAVIMPEARTISVYAESPFGAAMCVVS